MIKIKIHTWISLGIAAALSLSFGGPRTVDAKPLEIQFAVHVPGPPLVLQRPLDLSLDQRLQTQQIIWEHQMRTELRSRLASRRSSDAGSLESNPFPTLAAMLADSYQALNAR